jgi:hypothetical protein
LVLRLQLSLLPLVG